MKPSSWEKIIFESAFTGITSFNNIQTIDNIEFSAAKLESIIFPNTFEVGISPSKIETEEITVVTARVFTVPELWAFRSKTFTHAQTGRKGSAE